MLNLYFFWNGSVRLVGLELDLHPYLLSCYILSNYLVVLLTSHIDGIRTYQYLLGSQLNYLILSFLFLL